MLAPAEISEQNQSATQHTFNLGAPIRCPLETQLPLRQNSTGVPLSVEARPATCALPMGSIRPGMSQTGS
jgi:hypothetical protein